MSKKIKITEKKSTIKVLPSPKKSDESLDDVVETPTFIPSSSNSVARTPTLRENTPIVAPQDQIPQFREQTRNTGGAERATGYEIQTDEASREGYIFRPSERSFYENSRRQRTGEVSGQRAIPVIEPNNNVVQGVRLQHNQTGLRNNSVVQVGDNDRQYVQYDEQSEMKTKKRSDWRL